MKVCGCLSGLCPYPRRGVPLERTQATRQGRPVSACLYNFPERRYGLFFLGKAADDVLPGDDADKAVQVIHYGDEIVADNGVQQFIQRGGYADGGIFPKNVTDMEPFQFLGGAGARGAFVGQEPPEKISFTDGTHILSSAVDDGDGATAMVPEFFQALAHGIVVVQIGDAVLRRQKVSNIHNDASFLMGGSSRLGLGGGLPYL